MKINQVIYKQAKNAVEEKRMLQIYIKTCIEARICPKCGKNDLEKYIKREDYIECVEYNLAEGTEYKCRHCNWKLSDLEE